MKKEKGPYIDVGEISEERFGGVRANAKENGEIIKKVPESALLDELLAEIEKL